MKMIKKVIGVLLAVCVIMISVVPAFAASDVEEMVLSHRFRAYQLFAADSVEGKLLVHVRWGSMFRDADAPESFLGELKSNSSFAAGGSNIFASCSTAENVAGVLENYEDDSEVVKAFAACASGYMNNTYSDTTFANGDTIGEAGYYLFQDAVDDADGSYSVANAVILRMAADSKVDISVKADMPKIEKKVRENTYTTDSASSTIVSGTGRDAVPLHYGAGYNDAADYCIGDAVPFELIGSIPDYLSTYDTYYYAFVDRLSAGLTFTETDGFTVSRYDVVNGNYTFVADVTDAFTLSVTALESGETELVFECGDLITAIPGLKSTSVLIVRYESRLNRNAVIGWDGNENTAYLRYSNNPSNRSSHGQTPPDKVIVFTYQLEGNKLDTAGHPLEGASFLLINEKGEFYSANTSGSRWVSEEKDAQPITSGENGSFVVKGLDKGRYFLREKVAPEGFKALEKDIEFEISATILPDISDELAQSWTTTASDALTSFSARLVRNPENAVSRFDVSAVSDATVFMDIVNSKLYDLPGTGGVGTTVIYIIGGVLLAAGVVLIIIKRRSK